MGYGIAEIQDDGQVGQVILCEACFNSSNVTDAIARKVLGAPDMKISEGGEATQEQVREIAAALSEGQDATAH